MPSLRSDSETNLLGSQIELPLLKRLASIRSYSASRISWHSHDSFEMLLPMEGSTAYEIGDNRTVDLPGRHFMVIPPGVMHRGLHDIRRPVSLKGLMIDLSEEKLRKNSPFSNREFLQLRKRFQQGAMVSRRMSPELVKGIKELPQDFESLDLTDMHVVVRLRMTICSILIEASRQMDSPPSVEPKCMAQAAIDFMRNHLSDSCSVEDIAREVHCSRARLFDVFKESVGMTPNDYWLRLRINHAQKLLQDESKSILDVALDCGFSTSQYFSSVFRKYSGVTPSDYRRSISQASAS